ncbi:SPOR domain-containing protein [Plastorhodobacter daqingensis]|uniref:SPOR domain-containing protein n=1 Tax=Plastorhodobacter daqingensis TaxID=1387281 RepID=A0ABW2UI46_9RHOB
MMRARGSLAAVCLALALPAQADPLLAPSEFPPEGHAVREWQDSRGCSFMRADHGSDLIWAPRVDENGEQLCAATTSRATGRRPPGAAASGRKAAASVQGPHRHVQVGVFADPANAEQAIATIIALGLPAGIGRFDRGGATLTVVAAGPFEEPAALARARWLLRNAGFPDAYTRP